MDNNAIEERKEKVLEITPIRPAKGRELLRDRSGLMVPRLSSEDTPCLLNGEEEVYLDWRGLVMLFWDLFPEGALESELISDTAEGVTFEARIWADKKDERMLSSAVYKSIYTDNVCDTFASCQTMALRTALIWAGVGTETVLEAEILRRKEKIRNGGGAPVDFTKGSEMTSNQLFDALLELKSEEDAAVVPEKAKEPETKKTPEAKTEKNPEPETDVAPEVKPEEKPEPEKKPKKRKARAKKEPKPEPIEVTPEPVETPAIAEDDPFAAAGVMPKSAATEETAETTEEAKAEKPEASEEKPEPEPETKEVLESEIKLETIVVEPEEQEKPAEGEDGVYVVQEGDFLQERHNKRFTGMKLSEIDTDFLEYFNEVARENCSERVLKEIEKFLIGM